MLPSRYSDASSNVLTCWPAAFDAPTLPTIEAFASLSGAKGELYSSPDKEFGTVLTFPGL